MNAQISHEVALSKKSITIRPSDLITSLTYVLMEKFYPCFKKSPIRFF